MTTRTLRRLRYLALRTLRRTPLVHHRQASARHLHRCTPPAENGSWPKCPAPEPRRTGEPPRGREGSSRSAETPRIFSALKSVWCCT
ncbi:hypothetical protein ACFWJY_25755 [Streptomyces anulatus]|uniref:hypothetical protein n=1 Tax=Streptomyces anulatus TaxID=1892 RepID=UPI0036556F70